MFDYRYYRTIRTPVDWKTGGTIWGTKREKTALPWGPGKQEPSSLSLSLFFFSTSASLTPSCSQSISRTPHVCAIAVGTMELLE